MLDSNLTLFTWPLPYIYPLYIKNIHVLTHLPTLPHLQLVDHSWTKLLRWFEGLRTAPARRVFETLYGTEKNHIRKNEKIQRICTACRGTKFGKWQEHVPSIPCGNCQAHEMAHCSPGETIVPRRFWHVELSQFCKVDRWIHNRRLAIVHTEHGNGVERTRAVSQHVIFFQRGKVNRDVDSSYRIRFGVQWFSILKAAQFYSEFVFFCLGCNLESRVLWGKVFYRNVRFGKCTDYCWV